MGSSVMDTLINIGTFGLGGSKKKIKKKEKAKADAKVAAQSRRANAAEESSAIQKFNVASGIAQPTGVLDQAATSGRGNILGN